MSGCCRMFMPFFYHLSGIRMSTKPKSSTFTRRLPLFLLPEDEDAFSRGLKDNFPSVQFIDYPTWPPTAATIHQSIANSGSKYVYIWFPDILSKPRKNARPEYGAPICLAFLLERSWFWPNEENILYSGRLAISLEQTDLEDSEAPLAIAKQVAYRLRQQNAASLMLVTPATQTNMLDRIKSYIVGKQVVQWCQENPAGFLRDASRKSLNYRPEF